MSRLVMGIDPGVNGGIAIVNMDSHEVVDVAAMPDTLTDISEFIEKYKDVTAAYVEKVHSMPKQGVASTFTFGMFYGYVLMGVTAHKIRKIDVMPAKWQAEMGVKSKKGEDKTSHKNRLKSLAQHLFPKTKVTLKNADALLLAEYGCKEETRSLR
ncbi:hypothetical protein [Prevotella sp. E2-28]|uniref:hypothetical protein n=1 Tax=Prevotella sp. E2-28 TaxID=2913620 RepID=UPI001EDABC8E|nr:hypothetical protein [Prevotella sp. E2-28]UKK52680.1 hypothetical protein L6465_08690 [Prevotella sp. E2-28]